MAKTKKPAKKYPTCLAILLCDYFVMDPNSSKPNIFGVFDTFTPDELPAEARCFVYGKLYGGNGSIPLIIELQDSTGTPVEGGQIELGPLKCTPKSVAQIGGGFGRLILKKKGAHKLVFRSGRKIIAESSPIEVNLKGKK